MKKLVILFLVFSISGLLNAQLNELKTASKKPVPFLPASALKGLSGAAMRLDSTKTENWSGTAWDLISNMRYSYSKNGNTTTVIVQKKDASTLFSWQNSQMMDTTLNASGKVIQVITSDWTTNQWTQLYKDEYSYNGSGDLVERTISANDPVTGWWVSYKFEFIFTGSILTSEIDYTGTSSGLVKTTKYDFFYTDGNVTRMERSAWDGSKWERKYKYERTYNAGGKMLSETESRYNIDGLSFEKTNKTEFAYNANGSIILQMGWKWDYTPTFLPDWIRVDSISQSYDASGRNTLFAIYSWDRTASKWATDYKIETSYGETPVSFSIMTHYFGIPGGWNPAARTTSYYSSATTGLLSRGEKISVSAFPNPASDYVEFSLPPAVISGRIELYDSGGRKILDMRMPDDRRLQVGNLDRGLYIYRIKSDGLLFTGKILVE